MKYQRVVAEWTSPDGTISQIVEDVEVDEPVVENDEDEHIPMFIRDEDAEAPILNLPATHGGGPEDKPTVRNDVNGLPVLETPKMNFEKKSPQDQAKDDPVFIPEDDGDPSMFVPDADDPVFAAEEELRNVATDAPILNTPQPTFQKKSKDKSNTSDDNTDDDPILNAPGDSQ